MKNLLLAAIIICASSIGNAAERKAVFNEGWSFSLQDDIAAKEDRGDR